jgi:hypothetical protein
VIRAALTPFWTLCGLIGIAASVAGSADEGPWREPGQIVEDAYLVSGALRYAAQDRQIVGRNRTCFNNRPLYCESRTDGVALAGDRPFVRLIAKPCVWGGFSAAIVRDGAGKWFHDYSEVESRYRCGRMAWRIADSSLPAVKVTFEAVPLKGAAGFALRLKARGLKGGDQLVWAFGGARNDENPREHWDPIMHGNPKVLKVGNPRKPDQKLGLVPDWCSGNRVLIEGQTFRLSPNDAAPQAAAGRSGRAGRLCSVDASACSNPAALPKTPADKLPMVCGAIDLKAGEDEVFWAIEVASVQADAEALPIASPARAFQDATAYLESIERVQVDTPDPRLDAAVAAACHAIDAACDRDPFVFCHGCMSFHIHFLGWRVICGSTALGWHDRVKGNAAYYAAAQVKQDPARTRPQPDANKRYCHEGPQSRFYGRGHIETPYRMYNTQSQFFDQTIRDWRWTADRELESILRSALELHLEWARECFDPDDDGLYESYINTLPTDSVWYNGGGSVEESAYAYSGHLAAMDMARRAGDAATVERHKARAEKIRRALTDSLWLKDRGYFGLYLEQGGLHRVHSNAWVYSEFLPIDAEMTTPEQALQALYYTEWGLERIHLPFGGQLCQPSNWVPSKWSVRDMFGGDMWHLALAYFETGLADEGWDLLLGAMLETAYAGAVPGGFSHIGAGTDFADCKDMFARAVVEGLFGYDPDYPNGVVHLRPMFPSAWPKASIRTPDYAFDYLQDGNVDRYKLTLTREADVDFRLPICAEKVRRITLDGREVPWMAEAGFGCTWVRLRVGATKTAGIAIELAGRLRHGAAVSIEGQVGDIVHLAAPRGRIVRWRDFHGAIGDARADGPRIHARLARKPGHHLVLAEVQVGESSQWQLFKLHVTDPKGEADLTARQPREAPRDTTWECLDLAPQFNGDVRAIFKQRYLSPRPQTCSVRLGLDGYSAWTFSYWGDQPPAIDLGNLPKLAEGPGRFMTPQNVPFVQLPEGRNIAFTSLWDNWPQSVSVPVGRQADVVWLLVCGSTNPMQSHIANAAVRFHYADGQIESLELVPPVNFWSLCRWGGVDYSYMLDAFCLPPRPPPTVQLGNDCRAMVLSWRLRPGVKLDSLTLETLSQDVVIGLMGVSLMNAR